MATSFYEFMDTLTTHIDQTGGSLIVKVSAGDTMSMHPPFSVSPDYFTGALGEPAGKQRRTILFDAIVWVERDIKPN